MKQLLSIAAIFICTVTTGQQKFHHTSSISNITNNSTFLNTEGVNGNPNAIIIIEYDAATATANPHAVGVWYDGSKWAIFNQNMAVMPAGLTFNLIWKNADANSFAQKATNGNAIISHPSLNNNPLASFYASQVWNPGGTGGVYNNSNISVAYDNNLARWVLKNANGAAIPNGAAFNILVVSKAVNNNAVINPSVINPAVIKNAPVITTPPPSNTGINNPVVDINPEAILAAARDVNLGFETGLLKWVATGTAFANQPVEGNTVVTDRVLTRMNYSSGGIGGDYWKNISYPIGIKGNNWIGTYENGNGDAPTGSITSASFRAEKRYITFLLGGGKDINKLYVELQVKKTDYDAAWGGSKNSLFGETADGFVKVNRITPIINSEEMFRYFFDLHGELNGQYAGKTIRIKIVDEKSSVWGHINVDDIKQDDNLSNFILFQKDGFSFYADKDKPVWGYFDSHAHPAADEAFGKKYYVGSSLEPLRNTWSNAVCDANHTWGRTLDGFTNVFDPHKFFDGGWPDMLGYPKFNGKMHQKYQADLIKRAWQGGLKIFCALGINNMYIATRALGHGTNGEAIDDESVLLRQIQVMKHMESQNRDWMEIAYSPTDARRIILEGKLCVILGLESDVFGNFKSPDCVWGDRAEDRVLVPITEADADVKLENKLNYYFGLGLRQILPLHYLSKPFGGTAAFNGNTFLPQMNFYGSIKVKTGVPDRIGYSLYEDFPTMPAFVGDVLSYHNYAARIHKQDAGAEISMVSAEGLTPVGNTLFHKLMKKGFIIDQEHASYESKRGIISIARANGNYPVMASHCGPQGLSFIWTGAPVRFKDDKLRNFNTSTIRFVAHEMELNDESYEGIRETQGTIGVFALMNHKRNYIGRWGNIANDCPGSSKTVAQMYCYSLDKMNGRGVGLASDLPMVDAVAPRFGPYAAWALTVEDDASLKQTQRHANRFVQTNGVSYDVKSKSYYPGLFEGGSIDGFEEDVWKALAAWDAGINAVANEGLVALSGAPGHTGRIRNMVKGLNHAEENQLLRPGISTGGAPWEQAAMYCLKKGIEPNALTIYNAGDKAEVTRMYNNILPAWNLWKEKTGNNEPLRRCITGNRYWDFNLDGLAHYGLMPDLLQDLKNIGFTNLQLAPLFGSAEDYIQMWEKAELLKNTIRN